MDKLKRDASCVIRVFSRRTYYASRTFTWLFIVLVGITAVTACNTSPLPPTATTVALLPAPTLSPTELASITPAPEPYPVLIEPLIAPQPAYPAPAYPEKETAVPQPTNLAPETAVITQTNNQHTYLPLITQAENSNPVNQVDEVDETVNTSPTPVPTLDFAALQADLQANGQDIGYVKIGFHVSVGGNTEGLDQWMRDLDAAGVPFFLKSVDNAEPIYIAQELMKESGVPHTLVFRKAAGGTKVNLPNYDLPPAIAAQEHWQLHRDDFPPELDPNYVWLETVNEVDKNRSEWLAQFAIETAKLTMRDGYKWAAFGWSSGEPEPEQWQAPYMMEFLRLAGENPDKLAIALHEYSYLVDDISHIYPYKIGRFQELFRIADANGIPRPTVLITEWGWTYVHVPEPVPAINDIAWTSALYAPYPEVKGAAIWYLGYGDTFGNIADETQRLIDPLRVYALTNYFVIPLPPDQQPINPEQHQP